MIRVRVSARVKRECKITTTVVKERVIVTRRRGCPQFAARHRAHA